MKKYSLLITLILFATNYLVAQEAPVLDASQSIDMEELSEAVTPGSVEDFTPVYVNNEWQKGEIVLFTGTKVVNCPIKLDLKTHHVAILVNNREWLIRDVEVDYFTWNNIKTNQPEKFENANNFNLDASRVPGFFMVANQGKVKLLGKYNLVEIDSFNPTAPQLGSSVSYTKSIDFYCDDSESTMILDKTKKGILLAFKDMSSDMEDYMKKNKLKVRKVEDLAKAFSFYNSQMDSLAAEEDK